MRWAARIAAIDDLVRPIATRQGPPALPLNPLDDAGVREETEALLAEIVDAYRTGDEAMRVAIRALWDEHPSFAWAATLPWTPITAARFRDHLTLFSISDQGRDTRDAILAIEAMCEQATRAGVDIQPALRELEALSSDVDRYDWGTTRDLFRRHMR